MRELTAMRLESSLLCCHERSLLCARLQVVSTALPQCKNGDAVATAVKAFMQVTCLPPFPLPLPVFLPRLLACLPACVTACPRAQCERARVLVPREASTDARVFVPGEPAQRAHRAAREDCAAPGKLLRYLLRDLFRDLLRSPVLTQRVRRCETGLGVRQQQVAPEPPPHHRLPGPLPPTLPPTHSAVSPPL